MSDQEQTKVITVKLRVSPDLRDRIAESARLHNRSMNADMVARLEASFENAYDAAESLNVDALFAILAERLGSHGYTLTVSLTNPAK